MGVRVNLTVFTASEKQARRACRLAFDRVAQLENVFSDYRATSEINRLCASAGKGPQAVSYDLFFVLEKAMSVARPSDGAFDVTAAPLIQLWRQARKTQVLPGTAKIAAARNLTGWRGVELDRSRQTVRLRPGMKLDFGGIAKGYAGDCALDVLRREGVKSALFEAGGDLVLGDAPPGQVGWRVQNDNAPGRPVKFFSNCAISTSGDTNQFVVIGGRRYSHIVNPKSGLGLTNRVAVTVIAQRGVTSDALSTALSITGPRQSQRVRRAFPQAKLFVRFLL